MGREKVRGRDLFERFLNGEPMRRPPFVPMIRGLLSRVEGMPMESLTSDPTLWANSLMKTTQLFGFDGVVVGADFSLMAEACGCQILWKDDRPVVMPPQRGLNESPEQSGRLRHALEAASRLFETCRSDLACLGALTGPVTLASQLLGEDEGPRRTGEVKPLMVRVVEAFCATRPDALIFLEASPLAGAGPTQSDRRIYNTLKNIASHYDIPAGLYLQGYSSEGLSGISQLDMDIYILGPAIDQSLPPVFGLWELGKRSLGVGLGLPLDDPDKAMGLIGEGLRLHRDRSGPGFFLTSIGPIPRDVNLEALRELAEEISRL
jgi:hypothetical protein